MRRSLDHWTSPTRWTTTLCECAWMCNSFKKRKSASWCKLSSHFLKLATLKLKNASLPATNRRSRLMHVNKRSSKRSSKRLTGARARCAPLTNHIPRFPVLCPSMRVDSSVAGHGLVIVLNVFICFIGFRPWSWFYFFESCLSHWFALYYLFVNRLRTRDGCFSVNYSNLSDIAMSSLFGRECHIAVICCVSLCRPSIPVDLRFVALFLVLVHLTPTLTFFVDQVIPDWLPSL